MNPFYTRELPLDAPFCNRKNELNELVKHSENKMNLVLFSPRRYGKTSILKRALNILKKKKVITIYVDFMGITSEADIADRIAAKIYDNTHGYKKWFEMAVKWLSIWRPVMKPDTATGVSFSVEKTGYRNESHLVEDVLEVIGKLSHENKKGCCVVFDEFQEITELRNSKSIEGKMRGVIQSQSKVEYIFAGSRRAILKKMFTDRNRAFFRSATNYPLPILPEPDVERYIVEQFKKGKMNCKNNIAKKIAIVTEGHAYYVQKVCYSIYEIAQSIVREKDIKKGIKRVLEDEKYYYEAMLKSLKTQQMNLLISLAKDPSNSIFSTEYMAKHRLGSVGGVQGALEKLESLDYIEKRENGYFLVDPMFQMWINSI